MTNYVKYNIIVLYPQLGGLNKHRRLVAYSKEKPMSETMNKTEGKELAHVNENELAELIAKNSKLQEKETEGEGIKADYILLAKPSSKVLKKSDKEMYMAGLGIGDFYCDPKGKKINLGSELKVVPLAFLTLYQEKDGTSQDARFFGVWNKEQAVQFPLAEGSYFNRQLPNGHFLIPVNWVCVTVIGHHELEKAVIAFKSTGSRIWKAWKEDAGKRSSSSATLVYKIFEETYNNDKYDWTDVGFEYVENLLETDTKEAYYCLTKSNGIREAYGNHSFVPDHDVSSIVQKPVQAYIADASEVEDTYDTDEEIEF